MSEAGLPTPNVFTGGHDFHSRFEWNTVQNLEAALAYVEALVTYWGEHGAQDA
jgi:tripeptide aminopeptidase